jgi:DnaJ-class molecular chaperone
MRCERCRGRGLVVRYPAEVRFGRFVLHDHPCPDCGGCGVAHCCDGLTAVNETPEPEPTAE